MLYKRKTENELTPELFAKPTAEFRGAPFWAWNTTLDPEEAKRQIGVFQKMGFGGFHMHPRVGLATEYLGEDYKKCVKACVDDAKNRDMLAYLYDEDKWPSGFAGGIVTKNKRYRQRYLHFTVKKSNKEPMLDEDGKLLEGELLLARYGIKFVLGKMIGYKRLAEGEKASGTTCYAYLAIAPEEGWYNDQTYVDTMNKEAMDKFAEVTYGAYQDCIGEDFGDTVPSIFTDEPQYYRASFVHFPTFLKFAKIPWTDDFEETYQAAYGESILDKLPEVLFDSYEKDKGKKTRLQYFNHATNRFCEAFADNLGKKCEDLGIALTGHLMEEPELLRQTKCVGDAMRQYKGFGYPGIDMLCGRFEYTTAKQCQSMVRQCGKEAMTSELYGVSRWNTEFCRFKEEGDWQAAMGVTIRVPHLSMMSMKGEAKRDYPLSFSYQSPWYEKYNLVEDHFARVNTALTRGNPLTNIAVIHPIESFWMENGSSFISQKKRLSMDMGFVKFAKNLALNSLDFDYICEATLPELCPEAGCPLSVGKMSYKVVVLHNLVTLRSTTLARLSDFVKAGGKIIIVGKAPTCIDGDKSDLVNEVVATATIIPDKLTNILSALEPYRMFGVDNEKGSAGSYVGQYRSDGEYDWLFLAHPEAGKRDSRMLHSYVTKADSVKVRVKGDFYATEWDTLDGTIKAVPTTRKDGFTYIDADFYTCTSKLYRLQKEDNSAEVEPKMETDLGSPLEVNRRMRYTLSEPNVLVLDMPYYAINGGKYSLRSNMALVADAKIREALHLRKAGKNCAQPWVMSDEGTNHKVKLKYIVNSEIDVKEAWLALENAKKAIIWQDGKELNASVNGYYVDKSIGKVKINSLHKGKNIIEVEIPFGNLNGVESMYLLGNFGVSVKGERGTIIALPNTVAFGDISTQGFPFYGGEFTYHAEYTSTATGKVQISIPEYRSALLTIKNVNEEKYIVFAPYATEVAARRGSNKLDIVAYISRRNAFGTIHSKLPEFCMEDPSNFRLFWPIRRRAYQLSEAGVLEAPKIRPVK